MGLLNDRSSLWIAGLGLLVYAPTLAFDFTWFDDNLVILDQLHFLSSLSNLPQVFAEDVFRTSRDSLYRPLLSVSLMLDAQWSGASPVGYHATSVLLHLLASCLAFQLFLRLGFRRDASLAAALLFTVAPVNTQAVAWVMGRNDSLLACFAVTSFLFFLRYCEREDRRSLALHLAFLCAALFTKESAVGLPLICLATLWVRGVGLDRPGLLAFLAPGWLGCSLLWWIARSDALDVTTGFGGAVLRRSAGEAGPAALQLLGKALLPFQLSVLPTVADTTLVFGALALLGLAAAVFFAARGQRSIAAFGLAWLVVFLAPTMLRTNPDTVQHFLEHRMYLPALGLLIVFLNTAFARRFRFGDRRHAAGLVSILVLFSISTVNHSMHYRDRMSFWQSAVHTSPSHPLAHRNLGAMEHLEGNLDSAESHYRRALELHPGEEMAQNNLGLIYSQRGQRDLAIAAYRAEIATNPSYPDAYFNMAVEILKAPGPVESREQAAGLLVDTLELEPNHNRALLLLRDVYRELGHEPEARAMEAELRSRGVLQR